jgi:hypothetical protein
MGLLEQILAQVDNAKRIAGRNAQDLISSPSAYADKIVGHLRNSNAGVSPTAAGGELTNRPLTMEERIDNTVNSVDFGGGLGVIKPKGGNWLSGKYGPEAQLRELRRYTEHRPEDIAKREAQIATPVGAEAPNGIIATPEALARWKAEHQMFGEHAALNNFVDNQLTKYVKNDMGAPTDPIRKLADAWQGEKAAKLAQAEAKIKALRTKQEAQAATRGVPEEYLTRTRQDVLAAEEARDLIAENAGLHIVPEYSAGPGSAIMQQHRVAAGMPAKATAATELGQQWENLADNQLHVAPASQFQLPNNLEQDPWLAKVSPSATVNSLKFGAMHDAGLSHLSDELSNSLREGRLTPEQLAKMPIDQAVKHVAEINALRAVKSKQEAAMDTAGIPLHKDYPDQGMSWRQLQHEDEPTLQKWLTQEGDAMGHCVGGYCPDVKSGRSSIYSLRDAKGQPHVTIETAPIEKSFDEFESLNPTFSQQPNEGYADWIQRARKSPEYMYYLQDKSPRAQNIVQIKGKNNEAPKAEHLPFIQDFIRSGKWSNIQDLQNAGMHKVGDKYLTMDELKATLARRTPEGSPILDQQGVDATDAMQRWIDDQDPNRI